MEETSEDSDSDSDPSLTRGHTKGQHSRQEEASR